MKNYDFVRLIAELLRLFLSIFVKSGFYVASTEMMYFISS